VFDHVPLGGVMCLIAGKVSSSFFGVRRKPPTVDGPIWQEIYGPKLFLINGLGSVQQNQTGFGIWTSGERVRKFGGLDTWFLS
jgi:hypothetical protein